MSIESRVIFVGLVQRFRYFHNAVFEKCNPLFPCPPGGQSVTVAGLPDDVSRSGE
jgi:hypothetical protein